MSQLVSPEKHSLEPQLVGAANADSALSARVRTLRNSRAVRWYVLTLPAGHRGGAKGLQRESARRERTGEPTFEYFAPMYEEVRREEGQWVKTHRPLLYNYVFVRSSEHEIYRMMTSGLSLYSFLPRVRDGKREYYPYLEDEAMDNLRWVARSYSNVVPVYVPEPGRVMKGDRVRITGGQFEGAEAIVVSQPGAGRKEIVVSLENWLYVPLLHVQADQYEIVSLRSDSRHVYTRLNNDRLYGALHAALQRYHAGSLTDEDRALAAEILRQYGNLRMDSDVTRCKLCALLLPAHTIAGDGDSRDRMIGMIQGLLTTVHAEQSRALLLVTLYGCTDSSVCYDGAHAVVDPWRADPAPKKMKKELLRRLDDYDAWLGHRR